MEGKIVSGLLKAGDRTAQSAVRRLGAVPLAPRKPAAVPPAKTVDRSFETDRREPSQRPGRNAARDEELDRQLMALEATVAELRHRLQEAEEEADTRAEEALERGLREGKEQAESGEKLRLEALRATLAEIAEAHRGRVGDCELLALQLALTALSRIFGECETRAELVSDTLAHHLTRLQRELVVGVRVSPEDFADDEALAELARAHGGIAVRPDGDLAAGECELDLKLGKIDIGLAGQWQRLSAYFDELASEGQRG
jgi:flagellar assembly protein FliH